MSSDAKTDIITVPSLSQYFFESLEKINQSSVTPLPKETIYYSSQVLSQYSSSECLFEYKEGKVKDKVLGKKLIKALRLGQQQKQKVLREVGDTALVLCGYFSESVNDKILDGSYYQNIGVTAYKRLNDICPVLLDQPRFFDSMATSFDLLCRMLNVFASMDKSDPYDHLVFDFTTDKEKAS